MWTGRNREKYRTGIEIHLWRVGITGITGGCGHLYSVQRISSLNRMIWLIPLLLLCLFLVFRFISPYETPLIQMETRQPDVDRSDRNWSRSELTESFVAPLLVSSEVKKEYQAFREFHDAFMTSWREALTTAQSLQSSSGSGKTVSDTELNGFVTTLSTSLGKTLPSLPTTPLPTVIDTLDDMERGQLLDRIPVSSQPYMDALEWMNQQMIKAQQELNRALQGGSIPSMEGFAGKETCADLSACFKENPDLIRQLAAAQQEEAGQRLERIQRELLGRFQQFQQPRLRSAFELNGRLRQQAKETQRKAQSGEWIKDVKIPGTNDTSPRPVAPPGTTLEELRRSNPERYAEYERSQSSLFSVKQLMEQINRNLR